MTAVLGISALYHDSAAALVVDGEIVAAAQEERFSRVKHDAGMPEQAIRYCLDAAGLSPEDLDYVGYYEKPLRTFERLLETYLRYAPRGYASFREAMPIWLHQKLHVPRELRRCLGGAARTRTVFTDHHQSHAASAFFPSPFEEAAILTLDGVGEWATGSYGVGRGHRIELSHQLRFPHSLGLLYSAFTYHTGFKVNGDEFKLMGLAPYGKPIYVERIFEHLVDLRPDGSFRMDMDYFNYCEGLTMTSRKFDVLFEGPPRLVTEPITQREMDMAASVQVVTEEIVLRMAHHLHAETGMTNLCLAGGVALNCVANGRLLREGPFERLWIQPASGDAGGALGAALFIWHQLLGKPRTASVTDAQHGSRLGSAYPDDEIGATLAQLGARVERLPDDATLCDRVADLLAEGQVVGWFQGRMEFGPRALGSRSILADPRVEDMQRTLNRKVKLREGFRPFAPAVLREHAADWFDVGDDPESPYMLLVAPVGEAHRRTHLPEHGPFRGIDKLREVRSEIPAVTHVDDSARVQTVSAERDGLFHGLLERFHAKTGCPVLVNTSFNLGWDPIVESPEDAYRTFMASRIDALCIGSHLVEKHAQPAFVQELRSAEAPDPFADLFISPCCGADLETQPARRCSSCQREFPTEDGIERLFWPHDGMQGDGDVTEQVKAFYEDSPFPSYDEHDSLRSLVEKSRRGVYARKLEATIPYNTTVLEVGCGTGQLSNFLGIGCRRVIGTDICWNSLSLGERFRREQEVPQVRFAQMNLFRPALRRGAFDVVLCNGVLHHTADPLGGFRELVPLLRPGGHFVLGLYNRYGRLATDLRRALFRATGGRGGWLDPRLRQVADSPEKRRAWFQDQYRHPHESKHTTGEVLRWFEDCGLDFVRAIPDMRPFRDALHDDDLFETAPSAGAFVQLVAQLGQIVPGSREGGLFVMIGRRRET